MRGVLGIVVAVVAMVAMGSSVARAQETDSNRDALDQEARALYEAGRVAFDDGRFDDALGYFERAHELSGRPQLLYNVGAAADRLRRNAHALESFEAYLEEVPDAHNRRSVEARIAVLREALADDDESGAETVPTPAETAAAGLEAEGDGDATGAGPGEDVAPPSRKGLWIGLGIGAAVLIGLAVVLAVVLADPSPDYQESEQGHLVFTLERGP